MKHDDRNPDHLESLARAGIGLWSWDSDGTLHWTEAVLGLFEVDAAPRTYEAFLALVHPDDRDRMVEAIGGALERFESGSPNEGFVVEHRVAATDRWVECRGHVVGERGGPWRMSGLSVDVTRRKQAELRLRQSEERYRLYAELASDYAYQVDLRAPSLAPSVVTGAFESTVGYTPAEVEAKGGWIEVIHPDDRPAAGSILEVVTQGRPAVAEYRVLHGDGRTRWFRDRMRPVIVNGEVVALQGAVVDVTDAKRLERHLVNSRKDEALVRFAGNAAHDFNNLLTVILGSLELFETASLDPANAELLEAARAATTRAGSLTQGMLLFGRRVAGEPRTMGIGDLVEQSVPMLRQAAGKDHELDVSVDEAESAVSVDLGQAQLLLLNLVLNARQAMPAPGQIRLQVDTVSLEADDADRPPELEPGDYVRLAVEDDGPGIAAAALPHVFEPFFTTRAPGEGSGLGLAAAQGIAQAAGGTIVAANRAEGGAVFSVFFPVDTGPADARPRRQSMTVAVGGTERVLLVDDEPMVLRIFARVLRDLGYTVFEVSSGEEALGVLAEQVVDLVVSDIVMPGMGGIRLAEAIGDRWPAMPILLTSGNIDGRHSGYPFLAKPVAPRGLGQRVREVLDGATPRGPVGQP